MPELIPPRTPLVSCPTCRDITSHTWPVAEQYRCDVCGTVHGLERLPKYTGDPESIWCPSAMCRGRELSPFWAAQDGRRQCRVCGTWVTVATTGEEQVHG